MHLHDNSSRSGCTILFDCGEGTQRQISLAGHGRDTYNSNSKRSNNKGKDDAYNTGAFKPSMIGAVCITHLHADHVMGLPGMILSLGASNEASSGGGGGGDGGSIGSTRSNVNSSNSPKKEVAIYGPPGTYEFLHSTLRLTRSTLGTNVIVYELMGSEAENVMMGGNAKQRSMKKHQRQQQSQRWQGPYATMQREEIVRNKEDQTWTLPLPSDLQNHRQMNGPINNLNLNQIQKEQQQQQQPQQPRQWSIQAAEIKHLRTVPTFAYTVTEPDREPTINIQKAISRGIKPGPKYRLLKMGIAVPVDDDHDHDHNNNNNNNGNNHVTNNVDNKEDNKNDKEVLMVQPEDVMMDDCTANNSSSVITGGKGRKFALLGDCNGWTSGAFEICKNADVLVHEATSRIHNGQVRKK